MDYKEKYLKYKKKYLELKNQTGGNNIIHGFGIEQETPIFMEISKDYYNYIENYMPYLFLLISNNLSHDPYLGLMDQYYYIFENLKNEDHIPYLEKHNIIYINLDMKWYEELHQTYDDTKHKTSLDKKNFTDIIIYEPDVSILNSKYFINYFNVISEKIKKFFILRKILHDLNFLIEYFEFNNLNLFNNLVLFNLLIHKLLYIVFFVGIEMIKIENSAVNYYHTTNKKIYDDDLANEKKLFEGNIEISVNNNILKIEYKNKIELEPDSGGYEIKNKEFQNQTVQEVIDQIKSSRENIINNLTNIKDSLFFVDDIPFYSNLVTSEIKYTGDIDINITLPYDKDNFDLKNFQNMHINLMKALQYLSPLFLGCWTSPHPESYGDDGIYPETSYKYISTGSLSRILTTDTNNIYEKAKAYEKTHDTIKKIILKNYEHIYRTEDIDETFWEIDYLSLHEIEFGVNRVNHEPKYNPEENKFFGFEWKIFDQIQIDKVKHIALFVFMIAQHIKNNNIDFGLEDPRRSFDIENDETRWPFTFLEEIIKEGWHVSLDGNYLALLKDKLKLDLRYFNLIENGTITDFLQSIHESLFNYFRTDGITRDIIERFFPDFNNSEYDELKFLPTFNKNNFDFTINYLKLKDPKKYLEVIKNTLNVDNEDHYEKMLGEIQDYQQLNQISNTIGL